MSLKLYDILGREAATLVDEVKEPGSYDVTFNARGLASGVYFCRLKAGQFKSHARLNQQRSLLPWLDSYIV